MKKLALFSFFLLMNFCQIHAQSAPGFDDDAEDTPIDGGIVLVAASALLYGYKRSKKTI